MSDETSSEEYFLFDFDARRSDPIRPLPAQELDWVQKLNEKYRDFFSLPLPESEYVIIDCDAGDEGSGTAAV